MAKKNIQAPQTVEEERIVEQLLSRLYEERELGYSDMGRGLEVEEAIGMQEALRGRPGYEASVYRNPNTPAQPGQILSRPARPTYEAEEITPEVQARRDKALADLYAAGTTAPAEPSRGRTRSGGVYRDGKIVETEDNPFRYHRDRALTSEERKEYRAKEKKKNEKADKRKARAKQDQQNVSQELGEMTPENTRDVFGGESPWDDPASRVPGYVFPEGYDPTAWDRGKMVSYTRDPDTGVMGGPQNYTQREDGRWVYTPQEPLPGWDNQEIPGEMSEQNWRAMGPGPARADAMVQQESDLTQGFTKLSTMQDRDRQRTAQAAQQVKASQRGRAWNQYINGPGYNASGENLLDAANHFLINGGFGMQTRRDFAQGTNAPNKFLEDLGAIGGFGPIDISNSKYGG